MLFLYRQEGERKQTPSQSSIMFAAVQMRIRCVDVSATMMDICHLEQRKKFFFSTNNGIIAPCTRSRMIILQFYEFANGRRYPNQMALR